MSVTLVGIPKTHLTNINSKWNFLNPDKLFYVYRHCRKDNNQVFYIGVGKKNSCSTYEREYSRAHSTYKRTEFWQRVANKYGYYVEIVADNLTHAESREKEIEFIALYGRYHDGGTLTNFTLGGDGIVGYEMSTETRKKMSLARSGKKRVFTEEHRRNIGATSRVKVHSLESREKRRKSMTGKKYSPEVAEKKRAARLKHCRQVLCLDTGFFFDCALDAGKAMFPLHWHSAGARITVVCNGQTEMYKGFRFCYV